MVPKKLCVPMCRQSRVNSSFAGKAKSFCHLFKFLNLFFLDFFGQAVKIRLDYFTRRISLLELVLLLCCVDIILSYLFIIDTY